MTSFFFSRASGTRSSDTNDGVTVLPLFRPAEDNRADADRANTRGQPASVIALSGASRNGGRKAGMFDSGRTSGGRSMPSASRMNERLARIRAHAPGYAAATLARSDPSASATPSSMFVV